MMLEPFSIIVSYCQCFKGNRAINIVTKSETKLMKKGEKCGTPLLTNLYGLDLVRIHQNANNVDSIKYLIESEKKCTDPSKQNTQDPLRMRSTSNLENLQSVPPALESVNDVVKSGKKQTELANKDKTPSTENMQRKMLICQKTNVKRFMEYHLKLSAEINYKEDINAKPPYSYAVLICLAMMDVKKKMTLEQIYKWIKDNFAYYRNTGPCWQVCCTILSL